MTKRTITAILGASLHIACGADAELTRVGETRDVSSNRMIGDPAVLERAMNSDEEIGAMDRESFEEELTLADFARTDGLGTVSQALTYSGACISVDWVTRLTGGGRERLARGPFSSNFDWCHIQGTGYRLNDKRIIATCQDDDDIARLAAYTSGSSSLKDSRNVKIKTPITQYTSTYLQHPSSTQIVDDFFPIAYANHSDDDGTFGSMLGMYSVDANGAIAVAHNALAAVTNTGTSQDDPHIGTLGMRKVSSTYVAFGCDYNCRNIYKFKWSTSSKSWSKIGAIKATDADESEATSTFTPMAWDSYQSLNFAPACSGSNLYLIGTKLVEDHNRHMIHLWRITGGAGTEDASMLTVKNVAWRHFTSEEVYFREGVALIPDPPRAHFLTFGEDFSHAFGDLQGYQLWFYDENVPSERYPTTNF